MKALELRNLYKSFGGLTVLRDLSFSVEAGERRAIIGPNGAGKTTLFNIISGFISADSGQLWFFGSEIGHLPAYLRTRLGLGRTFQRNHLFFGLNLLDNLYLAQRRYPSREAIQLLHEWGLWNKRAVSVGELSYGEQRQIELLLALIQSPRLLLLDEPTAGMSPYETEVISALIRRLPRSITLLIIEHDMEMIFSFADRITVLHHGELLAEGSRDEVAADARAQAVYLGVGEQSKEE